MSEPEKTLRSLADLAAAGLLRGGEVPEAVAARYAIALTPTLAGLMDRSDPDDPIARQFVPSPAELVRRPAESDDPIGDGAHEPVRGIVHRYPDRVLLKIVDVCPVYCRFCFRREMVGPGKAAGLGGAALDAALDYIRSHTEIWETILTGGDPFMLSERRARETTEALAAIAHVKVLRWHTRMPVADPARVDEAYAAAVAATDKAVVVAVHVNHARELTEDARAALRRLDRAGVRLISQSVLLRGVNDDVAALGDLMRALVEARVQPYYLHQLDLAPGTDHFRVPLIRARELVEALRDGYSGLCQPTFVVDIPGGVSKALAAASELRPVAGGGHEVRGRDGAWRPYDAG